MIFKGLLIVGAIGLAAEQAWVLFILPWVAVIWLTLSWNEHHTQAKEHVVVCPQPQPYPDMSLRWNTAARLYMLDEITVEELDSSAP